MRDAAGSPACAGAALAVIPSRRLVLAAVVPALLALAALADRTLLWPMLALDAALVAIAAADALAGRRGLVTVGRTAPEVLSVGRPNVVTLELRSLARRALAVSVTDDLFEAGEAEDLPARVALPPRGRATVRYRVRPRRRGAYALGDHLVRYPTPLGLWLRQLRLPAEDKVKVYPDLQAVRAYELLARQNREWALTRAVRRPGGESEFERLREYNRDDEFRSIDWKATARRQRLIAREYQLEQNQSVVFALDAGRLMTAESDGLSLLDHALNATLMLSHVAVRNGDRVGLLAFDAQVRSWLGPVGGPGAGRRIIQASYDVHAALVEPDYGAAFDRLALQLRRRSLVVLFTQVIDDVGAAAVARCLRGLLPRHLPLCVLLRDVELDRVAEAAAAGEELAPYLGAGAAELCGWRDRLARDLRHAGCHVLDVPPAGLTPAVVNRYLEIKARRLL